MITPRRADEVEQVEMRDWVSGWHTVGSMGDPIAGYPRLDEGPFEQIIASFTLMLPEGIGSCPATERFLRYDPARNSVDSIAYVGEFIPRWSHEDAVNVSDDFAAEFDGSWPAVIFQQPNRRLPRPRRVPPQPESSS
jgi:hypothetical protein